MVRAHVLSGDNFAAWRRRFVAGDVPSALPYGIDVLERQGWVLTSAHHSGSPVITRARDWIEHRSGLVVERTLRAMSQVARADLAIALLEREALLPALLKGHGIPPFAGKPLVIWSCWLADDIRRAEPDHRARLLKRIRSADLIAHLSRHETEIFVDNGIPEDRLFPMTYGVSHHYYRPGAGARDIELLAVGQDRGRDYATLIDAVRGTNLTLDLVCKPENLADIDLPDNVRFHGRVSLPTYRDLLQRARIVAVPTTEMAYPTGSSVALEAAASGCAVVVTRTRAMSDYFADGDSARLVDIGDVDGWRAVLEELASDPDQRDRLGRGGRENVVSMFNADHMWRELADVMHARGLA